MKMPHHRVASGFTLIELLIVLTISGILIVSVSSLISPALQAERGSRQQNETVQQARFAMQQMVRMVSESERLLIPRADNSLTLWSESVRDVLAVTMPHGIDRDKDGWADANNDQDYLDINQNASRDTGEPERIDEDTGSDIFNNSKPGIRGIDDNGDGFVDNITSTDTDDDEDLVTSNEDNLNGLDDDLDGAVDEDLFKDMNSDGAPGIINVDDDLDGVIDEGPADDDDEDGVVSEDWFDPIVFFLNGSTLMQRIPNLNPVDGNDYGEYAIAENVSQFRIERIVGGDGKTVLVDLTLELTPPNASPVSLNTRIRLGGML